MDASEDLCSSDERDGESLPLSPATAVAAAAAAAAEPPLAAHEAEAVACPRCTLIQQHASASHCEVCDAPLSAEAEAAAAAEEAATEKEWACSVCEQPLSQLAAERGTRVVWLENCSHWACVDCHIQWVQARDSQGLEPTCLTASCNSALTDAAIREMLGDAAHQARDEQLLSRAAAGGGERNWPCPTPNCPYRVAYCVAVEEGSAPRRTTCPRCLKVFVVGAPSLPAAAEAADDDDGGQQRKRRREEEMASLAALQRYQKCKRCGQGVEKDPATCDLFQCRCGLRWCWKCGTEADKRGRPVCACTGRGHVFWDNQRGRPAGEAFARMRPQSQSGRRRRPS